MSWRSGSPIAAWLRWRRATFALTISLFLSAALAVELGLPESVQIHGFASQGFILTTGNNFFGDSEDGGTFDFRELGINGSWRVSPQLQFSLQLLSRWAGEGDKGDPRVDYGFVDYTVISDAKNQWGVRLGRVTNPLGLYNDTRDVPFTRPTILVPESIYFDRTRTIALSGDGLQVYGERRGNFGDLFFQGQAILPRVNDEDVERALLGNNFPGDLKRKPTFLGRILYEKDSGRIRLGLSGGPVNIDYEAQGAADPLGDISILFAPIIFSAQYNAERWSLTGEYALRHFNYDFSRRDDQDFNGESFYLQGTYQFAPQWEGVVRYDALFADRNDRNGKKFQASGRGPDFSRFAKDLTVGLRWDLTPSVMLRAEYHRVNGTAWLTPQDNPNPNDTQQHWDLFAILASYRF